MSRAPNPGSESRKNFPFPASRRAWGLRAADFSDPGDRVRSDVLSHLFLEMKNGRVYIHLGCVLTVVVGLGARLRQAFFFFFGFLDEGVRFLEVLGFLPFSVDRALRGWWW